jgi:cation-transporting P-type ATPase J
VTSEEPRAARLARPARGELLWLPEVRWAALATGLFALGLVARLAFAPGWPAWTLFLLCYAAGGWGPGLAGLRALRERTLDVDLLMVLAAIGAAAVGQVLDGGLLIVIFATSGALEAVATHRTAQAVRGLLSLAPERAVLLVDGAGESGTSGESSVLSTSGESGAPGTSDKSIESGESGAPDTPDWSVTEVIVEAAALRVGDLVLVRPGERISADGVVVAGRSEVDQATITGEPMPAVKAPGAEVYAGTLNGTGALTLRVARAAADSVVARIVALVEEAAETKAETQLFIEKVEQRYSVGMVSLTLLLFAIPLLAGSAFSPTLLRAMTFMIVASPCAVVLATMPPLLAAMANAGRHGVLVKSAVVMERLGSATRVAFDKTGTLTEGQPRVAKVEVLDALAESEVLALAASAENPSEHPLARAIVRAAREVGVEPERAEQFRAIPGRGVRALIRGRLVEIGRPYKEPNADIDPERVTDPEADTNTNTNINIDINNKTCTDDRAAKAVADLEYSGHTAVLVRVDGRIVAVLGIADRLRPAAARAVARIRDVAGSTPLLLTGDNERAAALVAAETGIEDVRAGLLPGQKVEAVRELEASGQRMLVVGDGVNDAPALAAAYVGVAMGSVGSDLALDSAGAVIMRDDLATIPTVMALSRRARRVVTANLAIAAVIIAGLVAWDLAGHLPLPLGVLGHEGSTVIVGLNGLRLLGVRAWRRCEG